MKPSQFDDHPLSRREREQLRHREEILSAAAALFAEHGYENTKIQQIADNVEFSVGKIYTHFTSKRVLFQELMEDCCRGMLSVIRKASEGHKTPSEKLGDVVTAITVFFTPRQDLIVIYSTEQPQALDGLFQATARSVAHSITGLFEQAIAAREIRGENPEHLASLLIGALDRLLRDFATTGDVKTFGEIPAIISRVILDPLLGTRPQPRTSDSFEEERE